MTPSNVMLDDRDGPNLIDFGTARAVAPDGTVAWSDRDPLGTPAYLAPEQVVGDWSRIGPRTDVYALGGLLYKALGGQHPFRAASLGETFHLIRTAEPLACHGTRVPAELEAVCTKCLRKDAGERHPGAGALTNDLQRFTV